LSGTGSARAMGSVPLLRVTTSGSVDADLTGMTASRARVHARQTSRLAVRAQGALTIVAVDAARVVYRGTTRAATTRRNEATVTHL
ncbi:MAG: hypothetical protein IAI50_10495, partial [Candidatus Eremiobacteraeota bacterium]|nr:hypothetical protein [Candidatus Eremiobacteraeota bacterium]